MPILLPPPMNSTLFTLPVGLSILAVMAIGGSVLWLLRSRTEARVRAAEQRWKLLFEQSPLSIQIFAPDGQTIKFNQAWSDLFKLSDEHGYAFNPLLDPDLNASGAVHLIRQAFAGTPIKVPAVPFPINVDPPEHRWIGGVLYPVKNEEGQVLEVVVIHHDITEMKLAEQAMFEINQTLEQKVTERTQELVQTQGELAKALEQERELAELKNRFVSMMSHEFRTPLGVTMSAVELMRHYDDQLPAEQRKELFNDIHSSTLNMAAMMEQVLLLGKVEAGKLACTKLSVNLAELLRKLVQETLAAAQQRCPVQCEFAPDLPAAEADAVLLRHIFGNLLSNAVKYSPAGSEVLLRVRQEGVDAIIEVQDHGIGIPEKDRANLYEAFHRCGNVGEIHGTGLGLVIVKRCVDQHSGRISFVSAPGSGTTFTVRLPLFS